MEPLGQPPASSSLCTPEDLCVVPLSLTVTRSVLFALLDSGLALPFVPKEQAFIKAFLESLLSVCLVFTQKYLSDG